MMSHNEINKIVESAIMVVGGYAFIQMDDGNVQIVGLKTPNHVVIIRSCGEILETNMEDVELAIVLEYWERNKKYMEEIEHAEVL